MKYIGKDIYIQRGENWTLDFDVANEKGDPLMLLNQWKNPYLAITVTAARYEQEGDFRTTYWLDLTKRYEEDASGKLIEKPVKTFISTVALYLPGSEPSIDEALNSYSSYGRIVLDEDSDFDIQNYLFYIDEQNDGNRKYYYVSDYTVDEDGGIDDETWEEYSFRIIKQFDTRNWVEQGYLYDIKILAGDTVQEFVRRQLDVEQQNYTAGEWDNDILQQHINLIKDADVKAYVQKVFDEGMPLMPSYDTKSLILEPSNIFVSANIQGGID